MIILLGDIHFPGRLDAEVVHRLQRQIQSAFAGVVVVGGDDVKRALTLPLLDLADVYIAPPVPVSKSSSVSCPNAEPAPLVVSVRANPRKRSERRVPLEQHPGFGPDPDIQTTTTLGPGRKPGPFRLRLSSRGSATTGRARFTCSPGPTRSSSGGIVKRMLKEALGMAVGFVIACGFSLAIIVAVIAGRA